MIKIEKLNMTDGNRMIRLGFGQHEGKSFFRVDLWWVGFRFTRKKPRLKAWFGSIPESNGRENWTVILHTGNIFDGFTIHRSEYKDRARYDYDLLRYHLGEIEKPNLLAYDGDLKSDFKEEFCSPEGWQLVPIEVTREMVVADAHHPTYPDKWLKILEAAPRLKV